MKKIMALSCLIALSGLFAASESWAEPRPYTCSCSDSDDTSLLFSKSGAQEWLQKQKEGGAKSCTCTR